MAAAEKWESAAYLGKTQNLLRLGRLEQAVVGKVVCAQVAFVVKIRLVVVAAAHSAEQLLLAAADYD